MIISDTSALVLNFTSPEIWTTKNARKYFAKLDLHSADELLNMYDDEERYMQTQTVSNRKYFMRKTAIEFLETNLSGNDSAQVIILAAGIAPLSVEIASLFPLSRVFDVDKYQMKEKEIFLNHVCPNIDFIESDITHIPELTGHLKKHGWDQNEPTLLILEGIIYYLAEEDLKNILKAFVSFASLTGDFCLKPEGVTEKNRKFGVDVFRKIQESTGADSYFYDRDYFMKLLKQCQYKDPEFINMRRIQKERTGEYAPFVSDDSGWINLIKADKNH